MKLLLSFLLGFVVQSAQVYGNIHPDFKIVRSGYFREYDDMIPYETTAKVIFKVALPTISMSPPDPVCQLTNVNCRVKQTLFQIYHQNVRMLQTIGHANRKERQLGILAVGVAGGVLMSSVYSRISNSLFGTEGDAASAISKIRAAMEQNNKQVLLFEHDVRSFSINISDRTMNLGRQQHDILKVLDLLDVNALIRNNWVNLEIGLQSCFNRHVPITLVTPQILRNSLANVSVRAHHDGLVLSLSSRNVERYYKVNIADCFLTESSLYIMVNVPLSRRRWQIAQLIPVPFAFQHLTCQFGSKAPVIIAADNDVVAMDSYTSQFCDINNHKLCMVPSLSTRSSLEICLKSLFYGNDGSNTSKHCDFHCEKNTNFATYEVTPSVAVVTNGHSLKITCGSKSKEFNLDGAGAVELKLRCSCSYILDGRTFHKGMSCANGSHQFHDVVTVIPEIWSKISVRSVLMQHTYKDTVMNNDWAINVPNVRELVMPKPFNNFQLDMNGSVIIILGIFVFFLTVGLIAVACCYRKLSKL